MPKDQKRSISSLTAAIIVIAVTIVTSIVLLAMREPASQSLLAELPEPVADALLTFVALPSTRLIASHILLNWAVAMFAAANAGTFEIKKTANFLWMKILPLIGAYFVARLLADSLQIKVIYQGAFVLIEQRLLADLIGNLKVLGLSIPDDVAGLFEMEAATA